MFNFLIINFININGTSVSSKETLLVMLPQVGVLVIFVAVIIQLHYNLSNSTHMFSFNLNVTIIIQAKFMASELCNTVNKFSFLLTAS